MRYRQHEELEELDGGDDAATVEEPVVVEDAAAKRREEEARIKAKKLAKAQKKKSKREAKAAPNGAEVPRLGVVGTVHPARLSFSLLGALIRPQQALASVHTAAPALCTCTRNHAGWSVCAVVRTMSVRGGDPMRVYGSLDPAQAGSNGTCCGRRKRLWLHAQAGARMASNAVCCR